MLGSLQRSPNLLAGFQGPILLREREGRGEDIGEGRRGGKGKEGKVGGVLLRDVERREKEGNEGKDRGREG